MGAGPLTKSKKKKADDAARAGAFEEARDLLTAITKSDRADVEAWVKLAEVHRQLRAYADAESCARRAVTLQPRLGYAHYVLGATLHSLGQLDAAVQSYQSAVRYQSDLADAHYLLGNALFEKGAVRDAVVSLERAIQLRPHLFEALSDLGAAQLMLGDDDAAKRALEAASHLRPNSPEVIANVASLHEKHGRAEEALAGYRRAISLDPNSVTARAKLIDLLERVHRLDEAKRELEEAPDREHPVLKLAAARIARRENNLAAAVQHLEELLAAIVPYDVAADAHLLLGQLYDELGQTAKVFTHLEEGKRLLGEAHDPDGDARARFLAHVERARGWVCNRPKPASQTSATNDNDPIFLVGFPRSGTTLLEQVLDAHPQLQALDERPIVAALAQTIAADANPLDLSDQQAKALRETYFREAALYVTLSSASRLVDKLPLNIIWAPLIWRVFPNARFILAVRHPCDVCLSCLMQNFGHNDAMAGFVSLKNIALIYESVMSAWCEFENALPLRVHRIRYEDLVADFEGQTRLLLRFLDAPWHDSVARFNEHARRRTIKTPSYHQVTQPIYRRARFRWARYESHFERVLPRLAPFIGQFGYPSVTSPSFTSDSNEKSR